MNERELCDLGIFRIPTPVPFRQAGGPVNSYLVEEEHGYFLFDVGLGLPESEAALAEGLARTGHSLDGLNRIILSHGHVDHFGAASWLEQQAGRHIPVLVHPADSEKVLQSGPDWPDLLRRNSSYLLSLGMPLEVQQQIIEVIHSRGSLGRRLASVLPLVPGETFAGRKVTLEVLHMPGHTQGVCCLYERNHRLLFSADHVLERVSPNPLIELGRDGEPPSFKALIAYFASVERLRSLPVDIVLPGHAEPFQDHLKVLDSLCAFYERRQGRLLEILRRGSLTAFEATKELFCTETGFELFLMISETVGNLEFLEYKGKVKCENSGSAIRFEVA